MLLELFTYVKTPCPRFVRKMGYLYEAIALRERYRRCAGSWKEHLEKSRAAVLSAALACRRRETVVVLGSGPLLDVPLAELSATFQRVVLVDIVHMAEARRYARRFANVRLETYDISALAARLFENIKTAGHVLPEPETVDFSFGTTPSFVVSLNVLSQLPVIPGQFVRRHIPEIGDGDLEEWRRRILEMHCRNLDALPCDVCLIADYAYVEQSREGFEVAGSTLSGLALADPNSTWAWLIAPRGELAGGYSKVLKVGVWSRLRGSAPQKSLA